MAITDDLRKTLTDATPLYALAGTADLAAEKLGEVPALVEKVRIEAPKRFESVRGDRPEGRCRSGSPSRRRTPRTS